MPVRVREALWRAVPRALPASRTRGRTGDRTLWLTFDDGPVTPNTERVLEALAAAEVRATFCMVGLLAERRPGLVRAVAAAGHGIVNHGHRHLAPGAGRGDLVADVWRCQRALCEILGRRLPLWFRPPYGCLRPAAAWALYRAGFRLLLWSRDAGDSDRRTPERLVEALAPDRLRGGDVILLHDDYPWTAAALPEILRRARAAGFRFGPPDELLGTAAGGPSLLAAGADPQPARGR